MKRTVKRRKARSDDLRSILSLDLRLPEATRRFQTAYIKKQIARAKGNMSDAAERLGLHRSNLYRKMQQLGMTPSEVSQAGGARKRAANAKVVSMSSARKKKK